MTTLNFDWVRENFNGENFTAFDVGAADLEASLILRKMFPNSNLYAFEAFDHWHEKNELTASKERIHYFKGAVCDHDGTTTLHPSLTQNGSLHPWSSSIFKPVEFFGKVYGEPYTINSIRLETFCNEFNVTPDFIHIDVEGAELKVFQNIGKYKPKCIWAEVGVFGCYDSKTTFNEFDQLMTDLGYYMVYGPPSGPDALYCQTDFKITQYTPVTQ